MKPIKFFLLIGLSLVNMVCWSQSISLNPSGISPSSYNVYTQTAGDRPGDMVTKYTDQTVKYSWPFLGGDKIYSKIYASITGFPACYKMTVLATGSSGWFGEKGDSAGTITLSDTEQAIITDIWSAGGATRGLTQNITIDINNFNLLKAGNKSFIVTYSIY